AAPTSPAIDRGVDPRRLGFPVLLNPLFEADFAHEGVRPRDGNRDGKKAFDIGALEYNWPPVANAGPAQTVFRRATVSLNGSGSTDPDGDPLTFRWKFLSRPQGSQARLAQATTATPSFVADVAGTYVVRLIVNDGLVDSAPATVTVTVKEQPPHAVAD